MLVAVAISLTLAGITVMAFAARVHRQSTDTAYNSRWARCAGRAIRPPADMRTYVVTFTLPGTDYCAAEHSATGTCQIPPTGNVLITTVLPTDITFHVEPGAPTSNTVAPTTPDNLARRVSRSISMSPILRAQLRFVSTPTARRPMHSAT